MIEIKTRFEAATNEKVNLPEAVFEKPRFAAPTKIKSRKISNRPLFYIDGMSLVFKSL